MPGAVPSAGEETGRSKYTCPSVQWMAKGVPEKSVITCVGSGRGEGEGVAVAFVGGGDATTAEGSISGIFVVAVCSNR